MLEKSPPFEVDAPGRITAASKAETSRDFGRIAVGFRGEQGRLRLFRAVSRLRARGRAVYGKCRYVGKGKKKRTPNNSDGDAALGFEKTHGGVREARRVFGYFRRTERIGQHDFARSGNVGDLDAGGGESGGGYGNRRRGSSAASNGRGSLAIADSDLDDVGPGSARRGKKGCWKSIEGMYIFSFLDNANRFSLTDVRGARRNRGDRDRRAGGARVGRLRVRGQRLEQFDDQQKIAGRRAAESAVGFARQRQAAAAAVGDGEGLYSDEPEAATVGEEEERDREKAGADRIVVKRVVPVAYLSAEKLFSRRLSLCL